MSRTALHSLALAIAALPVLGGLSLVLGGNAFVEGPNPSLTGAFAVGGKPAEDNCTQCHQDFENPASPRDNLNRPDGKVEILDVPNQYEPGALYTLRVRLASTATASSPFRRWGFELTAVRAMDGEGAGTFVLAAGDSLQIKSGMDEFSSRDYIEHTFIGTRPGLGAPVEWSLQWRAPANAAGTIYFFCAGNAADGAGGNDEDFIYTTSDSTVALAVPVNRLSWGALKQRYR